MKKIVFVTAPKTFRDEEYIEPKNIFKKNGIEVITASTVIGTLYGKIKIKTESQILVKNIKVEDFDGIFFVGGMGSSVYFEDNEVYVDILFYNYLYETNSTGCFKLTYYGTKKYEQFTSSNSDIIKEHKENFLKYRFVFAQGKKSYVFDRVELVD